ncbi:hypothetical protein B0A50_08654 [Salinomyces thailandicus]|uniref:Xylanolytic transcriptional activator regulatory domain-containing protein n=1 Tax=Salinomyces thailandicus TaxID=706561 RepID=A0A4U0TJE7_9PEZI|nr:hypothetical protein B0A50_08654 [Salinomyces thailandica]
MLKDRPRDAAGAQQQRTHQHASSPAASTPGSTGRLVANGNGYRYVNNHLWSSLPPTSGAPPTPQTSSLRNPQGLDGDSIYENAVQLGSEITQGQHLTTSRTSQAAEARHGFLFSGPHRGDGGRPARPIAQPSASQIIYLWQSYLSNVDPMMKVFHAPSTQQMVLGQIAKASQAPGEQALTSSIYLLSTVSLTDNECRLAMQEPRADLISKFRQGTEDALSAAGFATTSDFMVLQAFVLYLAALRSLGDTSLVWAMNGLAIRIAGTMGLARDGSTLGLPPFECEMRRRLWWTLVYLDARTAELVGQDGDLLMQNYDVKLPTNVNDSELFPNMQRLPENRAAATDAAYILTRSTIAFSLRALPKESGPNGTWQRMRATNVPVSEKLDVIGAMEKRFEETLLKYCDPTVPLQQLSMNSAWTMLLKMRLIGNVSASKGSQSWTDENGYSDDKFHLSYRITQMQLELWTAPGLQKWRWHWQGQFQWYAFAELLRQTRPRKVDDTTTKAWSIIRSVFNTIIPTLEQDGPKSPLLHAIRTLLEAASSGNNQATTADVPIHSGHARETGQASQASVDRMPVAQMPTSTTSGIGAGPHNALLPGMGIPNGLDTRAGAVDPILGFDFDAIDWEEFDRLTNELCAK